MQRALTSASSNASSIRLEGVTKNFGPREKLVCALDGVSVTVEPGELMAFVGPSGCGKTTLLRLIAGLESVSAGDIVIGQRRVNDVAPKDRDVAMVFQDYALYPHMTVFENIAFALRNRGVRNSALRAQVGKAAELVGVSAMLDRKPRELSGGERQRVALGRAIVRQPKAFLLDEPLSNLDAQLRARLRLELAELHRNLGTTMLFVTHDQVEAMTLGDRITVLHAGRVQQIDTPRNIYASPANVFVARFIGAPPMNLLPQADGTLIGLRPEQMELVALDDDRRRLTVKAGISEHLGPEVLLHAAYGDVPMVVRLPAGTIPPSPGTEIGITYEASTSLRFDARTGARIARGS
ncbi:MAG: ABC transporter ATP-binding protein [Candidatus Eremiobacteraeota bacterium]|nr:ABC transporter ATP-binding protein [Candidatus Eremiobacteraeota bacterium]